MKGLGVLVGVARVLAVIPLRSRRYDQRMTKLERRFEVEHAGCPSCAERVQGALASLGTVEKIAIDEAADMAVVSLQVDKAVDEEAVNAVLAAASAGAGHDYRVRAGSWAASM
jgi:hypothetical protein